jgi:Domain of unknown function (DUF4134)
MTLLQGLGGAISAMASNVEKDIKTLIIVLFSLAGAYALWNLFKIYEAYNRGEDGIQQKLVKWFISMVFYGIIATGVIQTIL